MELGRKGAEVLRVESVYNICLQIGTDVANNVLTHMNSVKFPFDGPLSWSRLFSLDYEEQKGTAGMTIWLREVEGKPIATRHLPASEFVS